MSDATPAPAPDSAGAPEPSHPRPPTPIEPKPKKRSELVMRVLTASVLVPLVVYITYLGGLWFVGTVIVFILQGQREFYGLIEDKGAHPLVGFGLVAGAALPVVAYFGTPYQANLLMTATLLAVLFLQLGKAQITESLASISGTFFGIFYVGWLLSHAVPLRHFYDEVATQYPAWVVDELGIVPASGLFFFLFACTVVVWTDAGAYFGGRAYGRRKLAPKISPGKTVEGAIAGVVGGTTAGLIAMAIFDFFWPDLSRFLSWEAAVVFGIALSLIAILGDLVESLLKRDAAAKDAGSLLPGMGGILDRIDSPLLGIPLMYYMLLFYVFLKVAEP